MIIDEFELTNTGFFNCIIWSGACWPSSPISKARIDFFLLKNTNNNKISYSQYNKCLKKMRPDLDLSPGALNHVGPHVGHGFRTMASKLQS
jgi:hypothetical protein